MYENILYWIFKVCFENIWVGAGLREFSNLIYRLAQSLQKIGRGGTMLCVQNWLI